MSQNFYLSLNEAVLQKARMAKMLIMDVDGVLSDGRIYLTATGEELKSFHTLDGVGIKLLQSIGIQTAIITGRDAPSVAQRVAQLGIEHYLAGIHDKKSTFEALCRQTQIAPEACVYIGDDIVDLPVMLRVGLSVCVPESHTLVLGKSDYQTKASAGKGAVRELCDIILHAKGCYHEKMQEYLV